MRHEATRFLTALAQAVSTMSLYKERHPARERVIDNVHQRLLELQELCPEPRFTFLGEEIVFQDHPLRELRSWGWGRRLAEAGIQRLELTGSVALDDLEGFLEDVLTRVSGTLLPSAEARQMRNTQIRFGGVGVGDMGAREVSATRRAAEEATGFSLAEETESIEAIHDGMKERGELQLEEAEAVVSSLAVAMHGEQAFLIPLLRLKQFDQYTTTHALNVSILTMALAESIGLSPREVRAFGIAGLLHDIGKTRVPEEILVKPGKLTPSERQVMNSHPSEGAKIILETHDCLDLAAVVAYEHHIKIDTTGYPSMNWSRPCHQASNLVHICDVYDALRTERPYRGAWESEAVLSYIEKGLGIEFDAELGTSFVRMIRQWDRRVVELADRGETLPIPYETLPNGGGRGG